MKKSLEAYLNEIQAKPLDKEVLERYRKDMRENVIPHIAKMEQEQRRLIHKIRFGLKGEKMANLKSQTYTITASPEVIERFERFLAMLTVSSSSGHSGTFGMSFDGDGAEEFLVPRTNLTKYSEGAKRLMSVGYHIEIANRYGFTGIFMDWDKKSDWQFTDDGEKVDL